jgi:hypothetical protein
VAIADGYCLSVSDASGTETAATVPRLVPLRRNAGFRMLWIGQLLSGTGSEIGLLAYPLLILALTHSAVLAGVVGTARAITVLCLQLPAGALADRFDRRLTMITPWSTSPSPACSSPSRSRCGSTVPPPRRSGWCRRLSWPAACSAPWRRRGCKGACA